MQKNVASQYLTLRAFNSNTGAPVTGDAANITAYLVKDGGAPAAATNAVSEVSAANMPGVYKLLLTQAETNADCVVACGKSVTANVVIQDKEYATIPAGFSSIIVSGGSVAVLAGYKKNVAVAGLQIQMTDSTTHAPVTGKTVSVFVSIDGGAYAAATPAAATEIANGMYSIGLSAANMNGSNIGVRCTATGCDDLNFVLATAP